MRIFLSVFLAQILVLFLHGASDSELISKALQFNLKPLEIEKNILILENKSQIELGKKLYFDPRIANSNLISCNTCHNLALGGSNAIATTKPFNLNVPTIFNANFSNPNADDSSESSDLNALKKHIIAQITGESNVSQNSTKAQTALVAKLTAIPQYIVDFKKAYGNTAIIDFERITQAILAFQNTLKTQSRFDDFLRGNFKALSRTEQEGLDIFIDKGCVNCHSGVNLGGEWRESNAIKGYKFATNLKGKVKIPTLRNIIETAPYLSRGQSEDLKNAIQSMTKDNISDDEAQKIKAFFGALSGKKPTITYPQLPMSGVEE